MYCANCTTFSINIHKIIAEVVGSIEVKYSIVQCEDYTTSIACWVVEVVDSTEGKYSIVHCEDCTTTIVCWVVEEIVGSIEGEYNTADT